MSPPAERSRLLLVPLIVAVLACSPIGDDTANGGLAFTSWTVTSIDGQPTAPAGVGPTMTFDADGTVSGSTGCNQYTGRFHTEGDRIAVGQVSSTLMGCDGQRGQVEALFLKALDGAATWRQTENGQLEISGASAITAAPGIAAGSSAVDPPREESLGGPGRLTFVRG